MKRADRLRMALGGAVCGSLGGVMAGALAGALFAAFAADLSLVLDGALLGSVLLALAGGILGYAVGPPRDPDSGWDFSTSMLASSQQAEQTEGAPRTESHART